MQKTLILVGIGLLSFLPFQVYGAYEISDGSLKAYYHLEDIADSSGNGYNLTNHGTTPFNAGKFDNAADFGTGNSGKYLDIANDLGITGSDLSVSCWYKPPADAPAYDTVLYQGDAGTHVHYTLNYVSASGNHVYFNRGKNGVADQQVDVSQTLSTSTFSHLVMTYDGIEIKAWINGISKGSQSASGNGTSGDADTVTIGAYAAPTNYADGLVDECAIFNKDLSADEIAGLYNGGAGNEICTDPGCGDVAEPSSTVATSTYSAVNYADFIIDFISFAILIGMLLLKL